MLSLADKNDADDDDDEVLVDAKSPKQKRVAAASANKHVSSGNELGQKLTQRKIQRWKVLVLDQYTKHILQPLLTVGDLRALGVTLIMYVKKTKL